MISLENFAYRWTHIAHNHQPPTPSDLHPGYDVAYVKPQIDQVWRNNRCVFWEKKIRCTDTSMHVSVTFKIERSKVKLLKIAIVYSFEDNLLTDSLDCAIVAAVISRHLNIKAIAQNPIRNKCVQPRNTKLHGHPVETQTGFSQRVFSIIRLSLPCSLSQCWASCFLFSQIV